MARPRSDIRVRIIRSARRRFLRHGVDGASLRTIARDARTNIGMVYYYFPTKDDLFLEVLEEVYVHLLHDLEKALADDAPPEERLRRLYVRIGKLSEIEVTTVRLVAREALASTHRLHRVIERFQRGHLPLVLAVLRDGFVDGTFDTRRHPMVLFFCTVAVGAVPQFARRLAASRLPFGDAPDGEALSNVLIDVLLHGVAGPRLRARPEEGVSPTNLGNGP